MMNLLRYIDDGAVIFESRCDFEKATNIIYNKWKTIGLTIHIGRQNQKLKTEAIYFPVRSNLRK